MDRKYKLGKDLFLGDNLLDNLTFDDMITVIKSNCTELTEEEARKELKEIIDTKMEDMKFLFERNLEEMLKIARKNRAE